MKVYVYAIAKNEEQFVNRWLSSMSEADGIFVLDTGSTDNTVSLLKQGGAHVQTKTTTPFRFDVARNLSLKLIPKDADICVCTDLDEVFEKGWRHTLEKHFKGGIAKYRYTWSFNPDKSEGVVFWRDHIHSLKGYKWKHPVHEVLYPTSKTPQPSYTIPIQLNHLPDNTKPRSQYLPLLELSVAEDPDDERNVHYLGREYMYYGKHDKAIETLERYLDMPSAVWNEERASSMRYIAHCHQRLNNQTQAAEWLKRAIKQAPHMREAYIDLALIHYGKNEHSTVIELLEQALSIKGRSMTYINEARSWGSFPHDLISISYYSIGELTKALHHTIKALEHSPTDKRIFSNVIYINNALNK